MNPLPCKIERQLNACAGNIARKLGLAEIPTLRFVHQSGNDYNSKESLCFFEAIHKIKVFPSGYFGWFNSFAELFKADYFQLHYDLDHAKPHYPLLIKLNVLSDGVERTAAYKWFYLGSSANGEKFSVIFYMYVVDAFRRCGLGGLLKMAEISLFQSLKCDFIQTYLEAQQPYFFVSLAPNLKNGFIPWPNIKHREELYYHQEGFLHLRKYLQPGCNPSARICFDDGACFISPAENQQLIDYISRCDHFAVNRITDMVRLN